MDYDVDVTVATSVEKALSILHDVHPDLLISEIRLPDEDGYSLIRKVKALEDQHHIQIPAIALTTYAWEEDRSRALSVGFDAHISKPFKVEDLIATAVNLTREKQRACGSL